MTIRIGIVRHGEEVYIEATRCETRDEFQQYFNDAGSSDEVVLSLETYGGVKCGEDKIPPNDENCKILEAILHANRHPQSIGIEFAKVLQFAFDLGRKHGRAAAELMSRTISVPNLSVEVLLQVAMEKLRLSYMSGIPSFEDNPGKSYEFMTWMPRRNVTREEVVKHFPEGFKGNSAAFIAWLIEKNPGGRCATILDVSNVSDPIFEPYPEKPGYREQGMRSIRKSYGRHWWEEEHEFQFVAFREIK